MIRNLPQQWNLEADFLTVGSGIGGLSAAIAAHEHGARTIVLERADQVGGVTALSAGQVWIAGNHISRRLGITDTAESGYRYLKRLSMDYGDDLTILNTVVHAAAALKFQQFLETDERIEACDENPFGVPVDIRGQLLPALGQLAALAR